MTHAGDAISYAELDRRADRLASVLRASGAGPESRVGVALPRAIDLVVGLLAVLKAGGTYVPIDPGYPLQRRDFMLADADVAVLLTDAELAGTRAGPAYPIVVTGDPASAVRPPVPAPATTRPADAQAAEHLVRAENAAYIIYTSGSTGVPKGVVVEHRHVVSLVLREPRLAVAPGDLVAQLAPTSFDASTFEIWAALCRGGTVTILPGPQLSVRELGDELRHHRPDWLFLTTGLFHLLADFDPEVLAALGTLITGGDILSPEHIRTAAGVGSTTVYAAYGPTETTVFASLHDADATVGRDRVPIGSPLPGTAMYVLDGNLHQVPHGELGEIYLGGERVARGYHRRPGITAARFLPDPFHSAHGARMYRTGDLGRVLPGGELEFHGRVDRQVKIRGFRVELGEVEAVLAANPDVSGAVALAVAVGDGEKRLAVYVTGRSGATLAVSELKAWAERRLPGYALPARYVVLSSLPLDANGKFDRRALPDPWASRAAIRGLAAYVAPRTELERAIAAAWTDSLELDVVGVHDNFFELGGDSLRSVSVLEQLRTHGFDLTAGDFFGHATVAELAGLIHRLQGASAPPAGGAPQSLDGGAPQSLDGGASEPPVPVGSSPGTEG